MWLLHSNSILGSGEIQYHKSKKKLFQVNEKLIFSLFFLYFLYCVNKQLTLMLYDINHNNDTA